VLVRGSEIARMELWRIYLVFVLCWSQVDRPG
jgi:hypothetical protein